MKKENITIEEFIKGMREISEFISSKNENKYLEDVLNTIDKHKEADLLDIGNYNVYIRYQQEDFNEELLKVLLQKEQLEKGVEYD